MVLHLPISPSVSVIQCGFGVGVWVGFQDNGGKSKGHAMVTYVEAKNALAATQDQKKSIDGRQCVAILASEGQAASQANKTKQQQFAMHPSAQAMQFAAMMSNPYAAMMGAGGSGSHGAPGGTGGTAGATAAAAAHPQFGASASLYSALGSQYGAAAPQSHLPQQQHPMQHQQQLQQQQAAAAAAAATTQASAAQTAALWQLYYGGAGAR
jgi:hypothetical protein